MKRRISEKKSKTQILISSEIKEFLLRDGKELRTPPSSVPTQNYEFGTPSDERLDAIIFAFTRRYDNYGVLP